MYSCHTSMLWALVCCLCAHRSFARSGSRVVVSFSFNKHISVQLFKHIEHILLVMWIVNLADTSESIVLVVHGPLLLEYGCNEAWQVWFKLSHFSHHGKISGWKADTFGQVSFACRFRS
jgi:hypothetical protein